MSMCIDPTMFGPIYWSVIHISCLTAGKELSDEKYQQMSQFVASLPGILPCLDCQEHLAQNLKTLPFDRSDPFKWSVNLHNLVNTHLGKPLIDYETALLFWESKCLKKTKKINYIYLLILLGILVVFGMVFR